jgi:Condensation domain
VFRLSDDDHILVVTLHHVISDGSSMMLFFRDLAELYDSVLHGDQSRLLDLSIQYVDFTLWQRGVLQEGLMDGQLSYWKRQLSEPLTPLKFSSGVLQNDEMSFFTARKRISISGKLFQSIKTLARQERTTPFVVLLTVLKILLSRYLGEEDIRVATLVANRHRNEVENLIGHFVNTVILRTRISENLNFKKLAQLVRETTVSAHSNQDIPFEVLLQTFENETTMRCDLLSPVLFIFQSEPHPMSMTHLTVSVVDDFQSTAAPEVAVTMFDLVLSIKERSEGLTGFLVYKMFVFDEVMVDGFIGNFKNLLERIVYDPNESVSALCSSIEI